MSESILIVEDEDDEAISVAERIINGFDKLVAELYDPRDREARYVELADRAGTLRRHPSMSISIGAATTVRRFSSSAEAAAVAAGQQAFAEAVPGSAWRIDRRRGA